MKRVLLIIMVAFSILPSCKKAVEQVQQDIVTQAMTSGRWYVQQFTEDGVDISAQFSGYEFQFYDDGRVEGILPAKTETGTWVGSATALTMTTTFTTAADPVKKFNAVWQITNYTYDYVKAVTTVNGVVKTLYLKKKV